eukprot:CAMPEP_0171064168 /NCGR_PEP_ID=MMETSP0766_2-20121228/6121_1 /TAXON_ID=439317 /ORGANISM="Gambierdiscus australes, Strain CAWD 149" /LENGTH=51 /DNA_ID=CAMNT_0011520171 /DNA_START=123 /DNA_END=274 /DNA_ORIENTATION=+
MGKDDLSVFFTAFLKSVSTISLGFLMMPATTSPSVSSCSPSTILMGASLVT